MKKELNKNEIKKEFNKLFKKHDPVETYWESSNLQKKFNMCVGSLENKPETLIGMIKYIIKYIESLQEEIQHEEINTKKFN